MQAIQKLLDIAREKKNIEKRERITKNEKMSNNNNKYFFLFLRFYISNLYFIRKYIWKNLVDIFIFVLQIFCVTSYWNCRNKIPTRI